MAQLQPPNTQTLRPQFLTQVGHEGNPVQFFVEVSGTLDSPNPFEGGDGADLGGPVLYPVGGGVGGGGAGDTPIIPLAAGGESIECIPGGGSSTTVTATGGVAPYTWSSSVGTVTPIGNGSTAVFAPPVNTDVSGVEAYALCSKGEFASSAIAVYKSTWNCDDSLRVACSSSGSASCLPDCFSRLSGACNAPGNEDYQFHCSNSPVCTNGPQLCGCAGHAQLASCFVDFRTAQMISDGCNPCRVTMGTGGALVTVTDAEGRQAFVTIEALAGE